MSLNTQDIFDTVARKHNATAKSETFLDDFFNALLRVGIDLSSSRVGVKISMPDDLEEDIDCDDEYYGVIIDGLNKYLRQTGQWGQGDISELEALYNRSLRQAYVYYTGTQTVYTRGGGHAADSDE